MPTVLFIPDQITIDVDENTKILVASRRSKAPLRFGCAACSCGTCAVSIETTGEMSPMQDDEKTLLRQMKLSTKGDVRLACQARVMSGQCTVDLSFQDTYSPED